jgi:hypothetical protein
MTEYSQFNEREVVKSVISSLFPTVFTVAIPVMIDHKKALKTQKIVKKATKLDEKYHSFMMYKNLPILLEIFRTKPKHRKTIGDTICLLAYNMFWASKRLPGARKLLGYVLKSFSLCNLKANDETLLMLAYVLNKMRLMDPYVFTVSSKTLSMDEMDINAFNIFFEDCTLINSVLQKFREHM